MALDESESELENNKSNLFESLGALAGLLTGGIGGAFVGGFGGALMSGKSVEDALRSGIGSLFQGATMGAPGLALNALGGGGGGGSSRNMGQGIMGLVSDPRLMQIAAMSGGANPALQALAMGLAAPDVKDGEKLGPLQRLAEGIIRDKLDRSMSPRFGNLMTDAELASYGSGERTTYKGVAAPGTPVVSYRPRMAMGGFIEGPGTGTSDSIPAAIYQNGGRVQEARLSDGEFVMTADAVKGAGGGDRDKGAAKMYQMMSQFERRA